MSLRRLRDFVVAATSEVDRWHGEAQILAALQPHLRELVSHDDWLPENLQQPHPEYYMQYLLHADPAERFSVVSFVWGPGQATPIHDHTVWGLIGVLRGEEVAQQFTVTPQGSLAAQGEPERLVAGQVEAVSPTLGDIHRVRNAYADQTSISIHVYGANIGAVRRSVYDEAGTRKPFVSGYSNTWIPNLWDRSKESR